ncbi:MAG TPA: hypothetical protein VFB74_30660 [Kribbellaceae bacterium]|nr:hypothetical protein [Kribbellaceae bacterium]
MSEVPTEWQTTAAVVQRDGEIVGVRIVWYRSVGATVEWRLQPPLPDVQIEPDPDQIQDDK